MEVMRGTTRVVLRIRLGMMEMVVSRVSASPPAVESKAEARGYRHLGLSWAMAKPDANKVRGQQSNEGSRVGTKGLKTRAIHWPM